MTTLDSDLCQPTSKMAVVGLLLAWTLVLTPLLQAFHLTPSSPARGPSLLSLPGLSRLNDPTQVSLPNTLPALPNSDPDAHEVSSGDGELSDENWRGASPSSQPGTPAPWMPLDFPAVTSPASEIPTDVPVGSLAPSHPAQGMPQGGDFRLPAVGPSRVPEEPEDRSRVTVELKSEQGKGGTERANTAPAGAASPTDQALDLPTSQEKAPHPHLQAVPRDVVIVTTLSPRPTVSTIPLATLPADGSHMTTEGAEPKGARTVLQTEETRILEQELLGRNQTTVKYLASFRSTQGYGGSQGREELSTPPFRPTQATGYAQHPHGTWKVGSDVASTPQTPQATRTAISLEGRGPGLPPAPAGSHHPASEEFFPSPSTSLPAGGVAGTQGPVARERPTYWGLIIDTTQRPAPQDVAGAEQTHPHSSSTKPGFSSPADPGRFGVLPHVLKDTRELNH